MKKEKHKWKQLQRTLTHGILECTKCGIVKRVLWTHPYTTEYVDTTTEEMKHTQEGCKPQLQKQLKLNLCTKEESEES